MNESLVRPPEGIPAPPGERPRPGSAEKTGLVSQQSPGSDTQKTVLVGLGIAGALLLTFWLVNKD